MGSRDMKFSASFNDGVTKGIDDLIKKIATLSQRVKEQGDKQVEAAKRTADQILAEQERLEKQRIALQRNSVALEDQMRTRTQAEYERWWQRQLAIQDKAEKERTSKQEQEERQRIALQRASIDLAEKQAMRAQAQLILGEKNQADAAGRVQRQAAIAESSLVVDRFDRRIAIERTKHAQILADLKGNDAAQEAEIRRHNAVVSRIQMDKANLPNTPFQQLLAGVQQGVGFQNGVAGLAGTAGVAMGAAFALTKITEGIKSSMDAAVQMQGIRSGLDFVAGGAKEGAKQFDFLRDETQRLGISFKETAPDFMLLAAAARGTKMEGKGVQDLFRGISEANVTLHLSTQQTAGAINAFQQMLSKGKVQAQEMNLQLGNALPGSLDIAARAMGVTKSEFVNMMSEGKIIAEDFLPKMAAELHKTFGESAVTAAGQARAEIQKFNNEMSNTAATMGGVFLEAAGKAAKAYLAISDAVSKAAKAQNDFYVNQTASLVKAEGQDRLNKAMEEGLRLAREAKAQEDQKNAGPTTDQDEAKKEMDKQDKDAKRVGLELTKEYNQALARENLDARARDLALAKEKYQENLERAGGYYDNQQTALKIYRASMAGINTRYDQEEAAKRAETALEVDRMIAELDKQEAERKKKADAARVSADKMYRDAQTAAIQNSGARSLKALETQEADELERFNASEDAKTMTATQAEETRANIHQKFLNEKLRLEKQAAAQSGQVLSQGLGVVMGLYHKHGAEYKAWAQAKNAVDTALSAQAAYESAASIPFVGFIMGPVAAGVAVAAGLENASKINSAQFYTGGYTGSGNSMEPAGIVHRNEYVVDHTKLERAGGPAGVERALSGGNTWSPVINVHMAPGTTSADAQAISDAVLRTLARNIKEIEYRNIKA